MQDPWTLMIRSGAAVAGSLEKIAADKMTMSEWRQSLEGSSSEMRISHMNQTMGYLCFAAGRFKRWGRQTFEIGVGLTEALMRTKLSGFSGSDLSIPYETFYIDLPPGVVHWEDGVYFSGLLCCAELFDFTYDDGGKSLLVLGFIDGLQQAEEIHLSISDINLGGTEDFGDVMSKVKGRGETQLVAALLLYLGSENRDEVKVKATDQQNKLRARLERKLSSAHTSKAGHIMKRLDRIPMSVTRLGASVFAEKQNSGEGATERRRHWVRGHFHHFWTGPTSRPDKRKLIRKWVAPHERCTESEGQAEAHMYRVTK